MTSIQKKYTFYSLIALSLIIRLVCIGQNDLLVEEAYYWNYSAHLDFSYLDHPPMVALLIKLFTSLLGTHEFAVRIASVLCWLIAAFYSFKLTELMKQGAGQYAVMLLAILPFFFLHSLVMTPDQPLVVCWSAALYCLYRALVLTESKYWYVAGIWLGLGMLSKYSIVLLGPATLLYLCLVPTARQWFLRKEPYICLGLTILLFTPVIYWNANHEWASFAFQSTRRLRADYYFSFHALVGLLILFLTPLGLCGLWTLFRKQTEKTLSMDIKTKRFLQIYTFFPLFIFGLFSLTHGIKFNWIGPGLLALIPWLAILIHKNDEQPGFNRLSAWILTGMILLFFYTCMLLCIGFGKPESIYQAFFTKFIAWSDLTKQFHTVAEKTEARTKKPVIFVPLDSYNISSELSFYQNKFSKEAQIQKTYPIVGNYIFGGESLMYRYWSKTDALLDKTLILISTELDAFDEPGVERRVIALSPVLSLWAHSQGTGTAVRKYYYKVVRIKELP